MSKDIHVTNTFNQNYNSKNSIVINRGGTRSSKSYSVRQLFIQRFVNESNKSFLITRKTTPALKNTEYREFIKLLKEYGYYQYCYHNKTDKTLIYTPNDNYLLFTSIDTPSKILSTEFNYIWMEEAREFTHDDYMTLKFRLSSPNDRPNQLFMSFNPTNAFHWIKTKVLDVEDDVEEIVSTYKDNPFLPEQYIKLLEPAKEQNPSWWRVFGEGEWGSLENIVYSNWETIPVIPDCDETIYGFDFGFNAPTAVVEIGISDDELFVRQRLLQTGWHNGDLISWLNKSSINKNDCIYADNAEPARIQEIYEAGYNIHPADKSVNDGLDFCKRKTLHIYNGSDDLIKEISAYSYRKDKDGRVLEQPIKFNDHLMDAMRYAIYTHFSELEGTTSVFSV